MIERRPVTYPRLPRPWSATADVRLPPGVPNHAMRRRRWPAQVTDIQASPRRTSRNPAGCLVSCLASRYGRAGNPGAIAPPRAVRVPTSCVFLL